MELACVLKATGSLYYYYLPHASHYAGSAPDRPFAENDFWRDQFGAK